MGNEDRHRLPLSAGRQLVRSRPGGRQLSRIPKVGLEPTRGFLQRILSRIAARVQSRRPARPASPTQRKRQPRRRQGGMHNGDPRPGRSLPATHAAFFGIGIEGPELDDAKHRIWH